MLCGQAMVNNLANTMTKEPFDVENIPDNAMSRDGVQLVNNLFKRLSDR